MQRTTTTRPTDAATAISQGLEELARNRRGWGFDAQTVAMWRRELGDRAPEDIAAGVRRFLREHAEAPTLARVRAAIDREREERLRATHADAALEKYRERPGDEKLRLETQDWARKMARRFGHGVA